MPVGYGSPIGHGSGYGYDFRGEIGRVYRHYYRQMFWTKLRQSNYLRTGSDQIRHDGVGLTRDNSRFAQHICSYSGRHCLEEDLVSTGASTVRRHLASSALRGIFHLDVKDMDHVLRHCVLARSPWIRVVRPDMLNDFMEVSFSISLR
ncbi:hypothetical protein V6N11_066784 [Hibiscus sabdariffa]|uniref:Uncharacterized protein n=1 Tax=Hibiscus sabdariffa TaxID=183260 RepID=A0ABR2SNS3_9ROSI